MRDTVRAVKPSLMRVFLSTDRPVEYVPRGPEDVPVAEQATKYMHYQFAEMNGYRVLNDAMHDALVKKCGVVKVYWDEYEEQEMYDLSNLNDQELALLIQEKGLEVLERKNRNVSAG